MRTEDDVAKDLRAGELTVAQAVAEMQGDVLVYEDSALEPESLTWEEVEDIASGSSDLFAALTAQGATFAELDQAGEGVQRNRNAGNTIESRF
jgi:hypothetical protein